MKIGKSQQPSKHRRFKMKLHGVYFTRKKRIHPIRDTHSTSRHIYTCLTKAAEDNSKRLNTYFVGIDGLFKTTPDIRHVPCSPKSSLVSKLWQLCSKTETCTHLYQLPIICKRGKRKKQKLWKAVKEKGMLRINQRCKTISI